MNLDEYLDYLGGMPDLTGSGISINGTFEGTAFDKEREEVRELREQDVSCEEIAERLGLSLSAVKEYCRVLGLPETGGVHLVLSEEVEALLAAERKESAEDRHCPVCGGLVIQPGRGRLKQFCSKSCKNKWLYRNRKSRKKPPISETCTHCGQVFTVDWWHTHKRKYCSLDCYYADRYKEQRSRQEEGDEEDES